MAKPTTETTAAQADVMPELDDDIEAALPVDASSDDVDGDSEPSRSVAAEKPESPREAAVRRYRELRDGKPSEPANDDNGDDQDTDAAEDEAPVPVAAKPTRTPVTAAEDPEVELKVNGATVRMKQSEAIAQAQIALASKGILDEVKALREETRAQRGRSVDPEHQPDDGDLNAQDDDPSSVDRTKANQPQTEIDAAKLEDIVERIQVGDKTEGRQALAELIEIVGAGKGGMKPEEIGRVVTEQLAQARMRGEIEEATQSFRGKYSSIVEDPEMLDASLKRLNVALRQDLVKAGMDAEKVASLSPDQTMTLHQKARSQGHKVRTYSDLFESVGSEMVAKYGDVLAPKRADPKPRQQPAPPAPSNRIAERMDRKRTASVQPRTAGMRANTEPQQKPKTRLDVLNEMRRSRGFTV